MVPNPPPGHPEVDWTKWDAAGTGDVRSPCPVLNALANHHVLPHDGKGLTKPIVVNALTSAINLDPTLASVFASYAITTNPDHNADFFNLDQVSKHGVIEHDVSLSRQDIGLGGDNNGFDENVWEQTISTYGDAKETTFESASKVRYERFLACKKAHDAAKVKMQFGIKECLFSYGETALYMGLLGGAKTGTVPVEWVKVLFEQERLPYNEGWRSLQSPLTQMQMNYMIFEIFKYNQVKSEEATQVGFGTASAVQSALENLVPHYCSVM